MFKREVLNRIASPMDCAPFPVMQFHIKLRDVKGSELEAIISPSMSAAPSPISFELRSSSVMCTCLFTAGRIFEAASSLILHSLSCRVMRFILSINFESCLAPFSFRTLDERSNFVNDARDVAAFSTLTKIFSPSRLPLKSKDLKFGSPHMLTESAYPMSSEEKMEKG